MKKILISCFVLFLILSSCKENKSNKNQNSDFTSTLSTDELFDLKDNISDNEKVKFINRFYIINFVDSLSLKENDIEKEKLIEFLISKYPLGEFNTSEINEISILLKNSKTKKEIIEKFDPCKYTDQGIMQDFRKLTDNVFVLDISSCDAGPSEYLLTYENGIIKDYDEKSLENIENSTKNLLENKLNKKFSQQFGKPVSYSKATINGKDFFTLGFYEEINKDSASAYDYNAMIAVSKNSKEIYYIYDDPKIKNDDWNLESLEFAQIEVPNNAKWVKLD